MLRKLAAHPKLSAQRDALLDSAIASAFTRGQRSIAGFGALAASRMSPGTKEREIYDGGGKRRLPGTLVRSEGDPPITGDKTAAGNNAYDSTGLTYDFYSQIFQRNSIDGHGLTLDSTVHSGAAPNNAFWNGTQMVFGDATSAPFQGSFAAAIDVVAHELTHGVTQFTVPGGGLDYLDQSGALNESWSDVFGSVVKQWSKKQDVKSADWLIGDGILDPQFGKALRSMKEPGTAWQEDDQPKDMDGYVLGGDVHTNSGIPNRAFFLAADAIGGNSWEKTAPIWYNALSFLTPRATFLDAAKATVKAATMLFSSTEVEAVKYAWQTVKVG
jgi:Zn-dependent metalloprotease